MTTARAARPSLLTASEKTRRPNTLQSQLPQIRSRLMRGRFGASLADLDVHPLPSPRSRSRGSVARDFRGKDVSGQFLNFGSALFHDAIVICASKEPTSCS